MTVYSFEGESALLQSEHCAQIDIFCHSTKRAIKAFLPINQIPVGFSTRTVLHGMLFFSSYHMARVSYMYTA